MYPDQQPAPTPGNSYDFIMAPQKPGKVKSTGGIGGNAFITKLVFLIGGAVVVMIVLVLLLNLVFGNKNNIGDVVTITQTEQELIRVSAQGNLADSQVVKNAAMNTQVTIRSQQQAWLTFLAKRGRKVPPAELVLKKNTQTDKLFSSAKQTSTFDSTYTTTMRTQLVTYAKQLKTTYNNATSKSEKALLNTHYQQVAMLLEQWPE